MTIFDDQPQPGGRLLRETTPEELPRDVLAAEIGLILRLGVELRAGTRVEVAIRHSEIGPPNSEFANTAELRHCPEFDAVLLACGTVAKEQVERWGLKPAAHGILVDKETFQTSLPGVFAAGNAIRAKGMVVRSVADGREVAERDPCVPCLGASQNENSASGISAFELDIRLPTPELRTPSPSPPGSAS